MQEIYLHRDDIEKILNFVDKLNPADSTRLQAGNVKITVDNSSGIGSVVTATCPHEVDGQWGEFTITVSSVENW